MTDEELQAIRERAEKATPGPWEANEVGLYVIAPLARGKESIARMPYPYGDTSDNQSNAAFIAHARTDIPALLAEVERLRVVERSVQFADSPEAQAAIEREHERWMAEHAALREIVQAVAKADPLSDVAREWSGVPGWLAVQLDVMWVTKARALLASETTN